MTAGNYAFQIYRGVTWGPYVFAFKKTGGIPVDLTGYRVFAEVRAQGDGPLEIDLEPVITDAAAGKVTMQMTDEETAQLPRGAFCWDLILENPFGQRHGPYVTGKFRVLNPITHHH